MVLGCASKYGDGVMVGSAGADTGTRKLASPGSRYRWHTQFAQIVRPT